MIKTYGNHDKNRVKVFFIAEDGEVQGFIIGNQTIPNKQGFQFYVDYYVAQQLDKCELYFDGLIPKLRLKEGEELEIPSEIEEKEREIEELERRLKELKNAE